MKEKEYKRIIYYSFNILGILLLIGITYMIFNMEKIDNYAKSLECESSLTYCVKYNIDSLDCYYEGYTDKGFLGLTDFSDEYYNCKEIGRIPRKCIKYQTISRSESNLTICG